MDPYESCFFLQLLICDLVATIDFIEPFFFYYFNLFFKLSYVVFVFHYFYSVVILHHLLRRTINYKSAACHTL